MENLTIYLDESGDLGFDFGKDGTSQFFTVTLLCCHSNKIVKEIKKAVVRTLKNKLNQKNKNKRTVVELKGSKTSIEIKKYFIDNLPKDGWSVYSITINKNRVEDHLQTKTGKKKLYNYISRVLMEKIPFSNGIKTINLVVDKCKNTEEAKDFNNYLSNQLCSLIPLNAFFHITHGGSHQEYGLQAVDLFCWGISRKNSGDYVWCEMFRERIKFESLYFKEITNKSDGPSRAYPPETHTQPMEGSISGALQDLPVTFELYTKNARRTIWVQINLAVFTLLSFFRSSSHNIL